MRQGCVEGAATTASPLFDAHSTSSSRRTHDTIIIMPSLLPFDDILEARHTERSSGAGTLHQLLRRASRIEPTADQRKLVIVACVYSVVIILLWNIVSICCR